jgi:hypothetical protein
MQVLGCGIPLHGWVCRQDNLAHTAAPDALKQGADLQIIGTDPLDGIDNALQNMVPTLIYTDPFKGENIQGLLDHANNGSIALRTLTDPTTVTPGHGNVEAFLAKGNLRFQAGQGLGKRAGYFLRCTQQIECKPGGCLWTNARETFKGKDKMLNGIGEHIFFPYKGTAMPCPTKSEWQSTCKRTHEVLL